MFSNKNRNEAERVIRMLVGSITPDGFPSVGDVRPTMMLRYLSTLSQMPLGDHDMIHVLQRMAEKNKTSAEEFEKLHFRHLKLVAAHSAKRSRDWTFVIPINVTIPDHGNFKFTVLDVKFELIRMGRWKRILESPKANKIVRIRVGRERQVATCCIVAKASGITAYKAWVDCLDRAYDLLLGVIEVAHSAARPGFGWRFSLRIII